MRYRLDVVAPNVADAVRFAGGWMYDRVMAGWDVTVLIGRRTRTCGRSQILGVETARSRIGAGVVGGPSASADRCGRRRPVRRAIDGCASGVLSALEQGADRGDALGRAAARRARRQRRTPSQHHLSAAARAFKTQALAAADDSAAAAVGDTETFRCGVMASVAADLIPAS